jgi:hypothetical protein
MTNKKTNAWCHLLAVVLMLSSGLCDAYAGRSSDTAALKRPSSTGCRFLYNVELELPFNTTALSAANRRLISDAIRKAKKWPDVQIQAVVTAGAYIGERDLDLLQDRRGEMVKAYLRKLGIPSKNIYVEPVTMTDGYVVKRTDGELAVRQIEIELSPMCKGGDCRWMCEDPRLWSNPDPSRP